MHWRKNWVKQFAQLKRGAVKWNWILYQVECHVIRPSATVMIRKSWNSTLWRRMKVELTPLLFTSRKSTSWHQIQYQWAPVMFEKHFVGPLWNRIWNLSCCRFRIKTEQSNSNSIMPLIIRRKYVIVNIIKSPVLLVCCSPNGWLSWTTAEIREEMDL